MDYTALDFWWKTSITVINMAIGVYLWWERHNNATAKRIEHLEEDVDKRLDSHARQLSRMDEHLKHVPTDSDLTQIHQRIDALMSEFKEVKGEFHQANHTLKMLHQYMLTRGNHD